MTHSSGLYSSGGAMPHRDGTIHGPTARDAMARGPVPIIHVVTTDEVVARDDFIDVACGVMRVLGARGALHLRAPRLAGHRLHSLAEGLSAAQGLTQAWLVVNDRVDVALAAGARGAQLTSRSIETLDARAIAGTLALGASVHDVDEGLGAARAGADWLVAGHRTAPGGAAAGEPALAWLPVLARATSVPVIAIGGMRVEDASAARAAGAYGVAVIRGIWGASNAEQAASDYLSAYDAGNA